MHNFFPAEESKTMVGMIAKKEHHGDGFFANSTGDILYKSILGVINDSLRVEINQSNPPEWRQPCFQTINIIVHKHTNCTKKI